MMMVAFITGAPGPVELLIVGLMCVVPLAAAVVVIVVVLLSQKKGPAAVKLPPCPECGQPIVPEATTCPQCGHDLSIRS